MEKAKISYSVYSTVMTELDITAALRSKQPENKIYMIATHRLQLILSEAEKATEAPSVRDLGQP